MSNNDRTKRILEFELTDAPAIMHALSIAASVAMMSQRGGAKARLRQYSDYIRTLLPPIVKIFDENVWCEMGIALATAKAFHVMIDKFHWEREYSSYSGGCIVIQIDGKNFRSDASFGGRIKLGDPRCKEVFDVVQDLAPMDCIGTFDADREDLFPWRKAKAASA